MGRTCGTYGREEKFLQGFGGETRRKETLGGPRCGWEDNIKLHLKLTEWEDADWIDLAQYRDK